MMSSGWLDFLAAGSDAIYVYGAYAVALALVVTELILLLLRTRVIRGHLGWHGDAFKRRRRPARNAAEH